MSISVIIPCYNEEHYLGACLKSLLEQSLKPDEIIVIDDGSTDRSSEIARHYPIHLMEGQHHGPAKARNMGAAASRGDILVFVDADMYFDSRFIELLTVPIRDGRCVGTFHAEELVGNYDRPLARCWNIHSGLTGRSRLLPNQPQESWIYRAIRRPEFERVDGYTEGGYCDDETIGRKLGVKAQAALGAICYHNNPETLREAFDSARWIGKSMPKKPLSYLLQLLPFVSVLRGLRYAIRIGLPWYALFRPAYDMGLFCGIVLHQLTGSHSK